MQDDGGRAAWQLDDCSQYQPDNYCFHDQCSTPEAATINFARMIAKRGTGTASRSFTVPSVNSRPKIQLIARQKKKKPPRAVNSIIRFR